MISNSRYNLHIKLKLRDEISVMIREAIKFIMIIVCMVLLMSKMIEEYSNITTDVKRTEEEAISASHETYNYSSASSHDQKVNTQHSNSDKEVLRQYPTHPSFPTGKSLYF